MRKYRALMNDVMMLPFFSEVESNKERLDECIVELAVIIRCAMANRRRHVLYNSTLLRHEGPTSSFPHQQSARPGRREVTFCLSRDASSMTSLLQLDELFVTYLEWSQLGPPFYGVTLRLLCFDRYLEGSTTSKLPTETKLVTSLRFALFGRDRSDSKLTLELQSWKITINNLYKRIMESSSSDDPSAGSSRNDMINNAIWWVTRQMQRALHQRP